MWYTVQIFTGVHLFVLNITVAVAAECWLVECVHPPVFKHGCLGRGGDDRCGVGWIVLSLMPMGKTNEQLSVFECLQEALLRNLSAESEKAWKQTYFLKLLGMLNLGGYKKHGGGGRGLSLPSKILYTKKLQSVGCFYSLNSEVRFPIKNMRGGGGGAEPSIKDIIYQETAIWWLFLQPK